MKEVRIGIVGIGNIGNAHAEYLTQGKVENARLTAICDINQDKLKSAIEKYKVPVFSNYKEMFESGAIDAVIIAVPHYLHPEMSIAGFEAGLHVICEKPAGVYTKQVRLMNEAAAKSNSVFALMYNQRTIPLYKKVREMVQKGELGQLKRMVWIITDWYRTQSYYDSGGWRATWKGEGGGVLTNQCPHNLDLWQWIFGMPKRVMGFCYNGKYHNIEVEDDVTAYAEYENGATAVFITTTGEAPGTNRLEITGDKGKIIIEGDTCKYFKLPIPEREFCFSAENGFAQPEKELIEIKSDEEAPHHRGITQNFVNAILFGEELISPGVEGINGLQISNAIYLSSWLGNKWVELPVDEDLYFEMLQDKIKNSTTVKPDADILFNLEGTY